MAALVGIRGQTHQDRLFDVSGAITTGGTPQIILPIAQVRSSLLIENNSTGDIWIEIGPARATATLTNGAVSGCTISNVGFGYSLPPSVHFYGGAFGPKGNPQIAPAYSLQGLPDWTNPNNFAKGHCVMSGVAGAMTIASIVIDSPGSGYAYPPFVILTNHPNDPFGCAAPSATVGMRLIANGGNYTSNGTVCTTEQISIYGATTGQNYLCKFSL